METETPQTQLRPMGTTPSGSHASLAQNAGSLRGAASGLSNVSSLPSEKSEVQRCIEECQRCHSVCLLVASAHCLERGGRHVDPVYVRTMLDCAEICETSANFMLRSSHLHASTCRACADVCEACAKSCEEIGDMQECVETCRRCAESCRKMAA